MANASVTDTIISVGRWNFDMCYVTQWGHEVGLAGEVNVTVTLDLCSESSWCGHITEDTDGFTQSLLVSKWMDSTFKYVTSAHFEISTILFTAEVYYSRYNAMKIDGQLQIFQGNLLPPSSETITGLLFHYISTNSFHTQFILQPWRWTQHIPLTRW